MKGLLRILLPFAIGAGLSTSVAVASTLGTQLLVDPGFDSGSLPLLPFTQTDLGRWMEEEASLVVGTQADGVSPYEGDGMLQIRHTALTASQVRQRIDVSSLSAEIAQGNVQADARAVVNASMSGVTGGVLVTAIAPSGSVTRSGTFAVDGDTSTWEESAAGLILPSDTTHVEVQFAFTNATLPIGEAAYGDSASLVLSRSFEGFGHSTLGQATIQQVGDDLVVSNIGASGDDGAEIAVGHNNFHVELETGGTPPIGATFVFEDLGSTQPDGLSDQPIGSLTVEQVAAGQLVTPDVSPQGSTTYILRLFEDDGTLVHSQGGMSGPAGIAAAPDYKLKRCRHKVENPDGSHRWMRTYHWKNGGLSTFAVTGGPTVEADYMVIEAENPLLPIFGCGSSRLTASGVSSLDITGEWLMPRHVSAVPVAALGDASFIGSHMETVRVSNIGSSGQDGFSLDFIDFITGSFVDGDAVADFSFEVDDIDPSDLLPQSAALQLAIGGVVQGTPEVQLGSLAIEKAGGTLDLTPDFAGLGSATNTIEVWDSGALVTSVTGQSGLAATVPSDRWPSRFEMQPGGTGNIIVIWPTGTNITVSGGGAIAGDELRMIAEGGNAIDAVESAAVTAADVPAITVNSIALPEPASTVVLVPGALLVLALSRRDGRRRNPKPRSRLR